MRQDSSVYAEDEDIKPETDGDINMLDLLFDERLRKLDVTLWSHIPIPNHLAIRVISHYLEINYAILPLPYFCSSFLVNSLLCWACKAYTPIDSDAATWTDDFFRQAQQDFSEQSPRNTLTTIAALQLLGMSAVTYGKDDMSLRFMQESVRLGRSMDLFDARSEEESVRSWLRGFAGWTQAASYTALGVFNWVSSVPSLFRPNHAWYIS
ncbi:hypothetical protein CCHL11_08123 [Colletotrichum chlorophyti]|uniref:Transcription factor domain-containing protein n=1 Tax=Colletotrichum chlorophyti TaxID=708187 RepID=A0A1Q8S1F1_9PEZI|nr:hypothetical protein CCHL11_08123 [Colletotrichum chlorophyti]